MLFTRFKEVAEKYSSRPAINGMTYGRLLELVEEPSGGGVLVDILRAARQNRPLVVLPLNEDGILHEERFADEFCLVLWSSGSSGVRKPIVLSDTMLCANADNAIQCNEITHEDVVYTVCSMRHTGGINAQSLPALLAGAHVIVEPFNAFTFFQRIREYGATITHIVPRMMTALRGVSGVPTPTLRTVMCGSDCVERWHVEFFIERGCDFIINYGLTEAGPIIINHRFKPGSDTSIFERGIPLGTVAWCELVFAGSQLGLIGDCVAGRIVLTGDCVYKNSGWYIYRGRLVDGSCQIIPKAY